MGRGDCRSRRAFLTCMAFPNRRNMNCNSSGVAALLDLWNRHQDEKTAFVLLDNDDLLHLGRRAFLKAHRRELAHKTVIELYCVGRGDVFVVSCGNDSPPIDSFGTQRRHGASGKAALYPPILGLPPGQASSAGSIKTPADSAIDETTVLNAEQLIERNFFDMKNYFYKSTSNDGWRNLAQDEWFINNMGEDELMLYLYVNENAVIIGKNQNPWKECNLSAMEQDNVQLVRRISGGGAVYHDMGNLNFSFIANKKRYDLEKQMSMILSAVRMMGIDAEATGRNDITVDGKNSPATLLPRAAKI